MPYVKSISRKEFDKTVDDFLLQIKTASLRKNRIPSDIIQCVFRNSIFQSSAALEEYIRSVLEDWIHLMHIRNKSLANVPKELIMLAAGNMQKQAFQNYLLTNDESKFITALSSLNDFEKFFVNSGPVKDVIHQTAHIRDRKYPSKKNISTLFKRFGINDIFKAIQIKGRKDYLSILESFSDIRTEIAHQHPTPNLSLPDLQKVLCDIKLFVAIIDKVLYKHVVRTSGQDCWKTSRIPYF